MSWPYAFTTLNDVQKAQRREALDRHGVYAQLSALIPLLSVLLFRLASHLYASAANREKGHEAGIGSPQRKAGKGGGAARGGRVWRKVNWWLGGEVARGWAKRKIWLAGGVWWCWLVVLCVRGTGDDYLHVTKRFGVVAASQLPIHYMLSMKSPWSPLALIFKASHEELNPWHRLQGRIIYSLLCLHASFYLNFFVQAGLLKTRLTAPVVVAGWVVFLCLTTIVTTALEPVRRWSYRVFFVVHLIFGVIILPMLFIHAEPLRLYVFEALMLFIFDIVCRKLDTVTGFATVTPVPHTNLVRIQIPVPASKLKRFHAAPGQHVYLSIPAESTPPTTPAVSIHDLLFNPFTIAEVSSKAVTLVVRSLDGPTTKALQHLSNLPKAKPPISIEGPLGSSRHFPDLTAQYDRILLIAGGVGATYILPLYEHLQDRLATQGKSPDRITFIWSLSHASEASWAVDPTSRLRIDDDDSVRLHVTRSASSSQEESVLPGGDVELETLREEGVKASGGYERPDYRKIVDGVFRMGNEERVAVVVCGPAGMARVVRGEVGRWVGKGRDVWFHDEAFGW
ncbi:ferric reductase-like protein like transmembrane component [Amylocarpus encephaloides]|uniref:ferric-chelate reductase (NADPH) n=1 Tax=Amylocarpus encephaloides TaxID=45428 RepID=A0A9P7YBC7_9HELO|nr:ferric reductase-like protein like transmembrane component [Amylocarpus encephaloides]